MTGRPPTPARPEGARGFTLLEVMVAVTISIILATTAMSFFLSARKTAAEAGLRAAMTRDAQVVLDLFSQDMRYLGAAVPVDICGEAAACLSNDMYPVVRRARPKSFAFFGDLPYPNTEVNGVMSLVEVVNGTPDRIKVTSELSGACTPPGAAATGNRVCDTRKFSSLTLDPASATSCSSANPNARTCPWGLKKWQKGDSGRVFLQAVDPTGLWYERQHSASFAAQADGDLHWSLIKIRLDLVGTPAAAGLPLNTAGVGSYVANIDRVVWTVEETGSAGSACTTSCTIRRRQCWGTMGNPLAAQTPNFANADYWSTNTPLNCVGLDGTGWETIGTDFADAQFSYLTSGGWTSTVTTAATAEEIRAIRIDLTLTRTTPTGQTFSQSYRRDYFLDNRDTP